MHFKWCKRPTKWRWCGFCIAIDMAKVAKGTFPYSKSGTVTYTIEYKHHLCKSLKSSSVGIYMTEAVCSLAGQLDLPMWQNVVSLTVKMCTAHQGPCCRPQITLNELFTCMRFGFISYLSLYNVWQWEAPEAASAILATPITLLNSMPTLFVGLHGTTNELLQTWGFD